MLSSFAFVFCLCFGRTLLQGKSLAPKEMWMLVLLLSLLCKQLSQLYSGILIQVYAIHILTIKSFINELKCVNIVLISLTCCTSHSWHWNNNKISVFVPECTEKLALLVGIYYSGHSCYKIRRCNMVFVGLKKKATFFLRPLTLWSVIGICLFAYAVVLKWNTPSKVG